MNPFNRFHQLTEFYTWDVLRKDNIYNKGAGYYGHFESKKSRTHNYVFCYVDNLKEQKNLISLTIFKDCFILNSMAQQPYNLAILSLVNPHNMANPNSPWEVIVRKLVRIAGEDFDRLVRQ